MLATLMTHSAEWAGHGLALAGHGADAATIGEHGRGLIVLAQAAAPAPGNAASYAEQVKQLPHEEHLGWLTAIGTHFIGMFQQGGQVFMGFVTGIIPTLVVLMTAFYALTGMIGEERVHGFARAAGKIALTAVGPFWSDVRARWAADSYEEQQAWIRAAPLPPPMTATSIGYVEALTDGDVVAHVRALHERLGPLRLGVPR